MRHAIVNYGLEKWLTRLLLGLVRLVLLLVFGLGRLLLLLVVDGVGTSYSIP